MYRSFYGLKRKPFQISTNPDFLWLGEMHKEALAHLKYGIIESQGFLLLTGDVGTGKTTLINALINSLGDEFIVARVPDPGMVTIDFMNYISHLFDMHKKFVSKDGFLIHFGHFLNSANAAGKKVVLIIDEAQRLNSDLLEEIRQLSNIENHGAKLLNIFLIGQNEFNDALLEPKNRALHQRISLNYVIKPLDVDETDEYIRHRLKTAGTEKEIFSSEAIRRVHEFSGGIPRRINIICDHSLLYGFYQETKTITGDVVRECVKDLLLPQAPEKTNTEPSDLVDGASSQNLKTIPSERLQETGPSHVWRTLGIVIVSALLVFVVTFITYPNEYQKFFSRFMSNKTQVFSVPQGINSEMKISDEDSIDLPVAKEPPLENMKPASVVLKDDSTDVLLEKTTVPVQTDDLPVVQPIEEGHDGGGVDSARTKVSGTLPLNTNSEMKISDEDSIDLPVAKEPPVGKLEPASVVLKDDSMEVVPDKPTASVQTEDLPAVEPIEEGLDGEVDSARTKVSDSLPPDSYTETASNKNLNTNSEMKISDEDAIDPPVAKEPPVGKLEPASVVLKDDSMEVLPDKPTASVQAEDLPARGSIEESNDDKVNLASTPPGGTSPPDQQDVTSEDVSLKTPVFTETVVNPKPETGSDHNDIEKTENIVTLKNSVLVVDTPVIEQGTEKETTGVSDGLETSASDENENEDEESTSTKTDPIVYSELEEYSTQNKSNALSDEPVEATESVEAEEVANEDPEDMDPTAVIDWVLKKRSE